MEPPAFLKKLWRIVVDVSIDDVISWNETGDSFIVHKPFQFSEEILPKYYLHNNIASFVRQLNFYGFRKVTEGVANCDKIKFQYAHRFFIRNEEELLQLIKRKTSQASNMNLFGSLSVIQTQTSSATHKRLLASNSTTDPFTPQVISQSATMSMVKNVSNYNRNLMDEACLSENPRVGQSGSSSSMPFTLSNEDYEERSGNVTSFPMAQENIFFDQGLDCKNASYSVAPISDQPAGTPDEIEECIICLHYAENNILLPPAELNEIFDNFGSYLDQSFVSESLRTNTPFSLCKFCFYSSSRFKKFEEQLKNLEKDMFELGVMYSECVDDRRAENLVKTTNTSKKTKMSSNKFTKTAIHNTAQNILQFNEKPSKNILKNSSIDLENSARTTENLTFDDPNKVLINSSTSEYEDTHTREDINYFMQNQYNDISDEDIEYVKEELIEPQLPSQNYFHIQTEIESQDSCIDLSCEDDNFESHVTESEPLHTITEDANDTMETDNNLECDEHNSSVVFSDNNLSMSDLTKTVRMPFVVLERIQESKNPNSNFTSDIETSESGSSSSSSSSDNNFPRLPKLHPCKICMKTFNKPFALKKHLNSHNKGTILTCKICNKVFRFLSQLVFHQHTHEKQPNTCPVCEITFNSMKQLIEHQLKCVLQKTNSPV